MKTEYDPWKRLPSNNGNQLFVTAKCYIMIDITIPTLQR